MMQGSFWSNLLPYSDNGAHLENTTIDVINKGCFDYYNTLACIRNGTLTALGFFTLFLCAYRVIRLHALHHPQIHQFLIFYVASLECVLLIIKWFVGIHFSQLEFSATILRLVQFILLCHFQWSLVTRILHYEKLITWIVIPVLIVCFICFTSVAILGIINPKSTWIECLEPHWLLLSIVSFIVVQLFMISGIYINRKINTVSALESFKKQQKIDLWSVILAHEVSAFLSLGYEISIQILGNAKNGCSGIYNHKQFIYSPLYAFFMIIQFLLPIWALVIFHRPTRGYISSDEERLLGWSGSGSTRSTFSPIPKKQLVYKQLYFPDNEQEGTCYGVIPVLRRSQTSPALLSSTRIHQPVLAPISEECTSHAAYSVQGINCDEPISDSNVHFYHTLDLSRESDEMLIKI